MRVSTDASFAVLSRGRCAGPRGALSSRSIALVFTDTGAARFASGENFSIALEVVQRLYLPTADTLFVRERINLEIHHKRTPGNLPPAVTPAAPQQDTALGIN